MPVTRRRTWGTHRGAGHRGRHTHARRGRDLLGLRVPRRRRRARSRAACAGGAGRRPGVRHCARSRSRGGAGGLPLRAGCLRARRCRRRESVADVREPGLHPWSRGVTTGALTANYSRRKTPSAQYAGALQPPTLEDDMKKAFITGITGQDGSYLAELLLEKGYDVHGLVRRSSSFNTWRIDHIRDRIALHYGDLVDQNSLVRTLDGVQPDEVYNLAAQSHVKVSFEMPEYTTDVTAQGVLRLLDAVRELDLKTRVYQAGSSEMFGLVQETPQTERTPFHPRSPYGVSKVFGHWMAVNYREGYGMHVSNGILFNHESPRRGENFVTRKITMAVAAIKKGLASELRLGNLEAKRDWGYARDYVEAMWLMLQQETPDDYVIATGQTHSVREFLEEAFSYAGLDWRKHVVMDPKYLRPAEVDLLLGDPAKARAKLGWKPRVTFKELVRLMVDADLESEGRPVRP